MRKLGRKKANRNHLVRNLLTSIILYEKVVTTEAKAKTIKSEIDRIITKAKKNDLAARRYVAKILFDMNAVKKTMEVLAPRYINRTSGYTQIYKLGQRVGDGAPKYQINLIQEEAAKKETGKASKDKKTEKKTENQVESKSIEKEEIIENVEEKESNGRE
ncbi:MAG: 50S ribosomal protein L17 [Patescibacteria group bacterium]|jgi:large subunit ribosomal protein L17